MKTWFAFICSMLLTGFANAQAIATKLAIAIKDLEAASELSHAIVGFYVVDQKTGKEIFARNAQTGLAVASSQKVITSAASLELLGTTYKYKTQIAYTDAITNGTLNGDL